ncbi:hypothetical protein FQA39_LY15357 [Lamprigera yunnana]|nr:hypothetical protein FQA39_LY15357 [Lamprigera yunnana]
MDAFKNECEDKRLMSAVNQDTTYTEFFEKFQSKNEPVLIRNVTSDWECMKLWMNNGSPDFQYLNRRYGDLPVTLINCKKKQADNNNEKCLTWKFNEYLEYWQKYETAIDMPLLYLKDWHLKNQFPDDNFYTVPHQFRCDWLNEYLVENSLDDYRFVYMGVKGTWTPFHADVMSSYSWSVNVCGKKFWFLLPPDEEKQYFDSLGNLPSSILHHTCDNYIHVVQGPGDAVFVPSNWYHIVCNEMDTISINHNWINGSNLPTMWNSMHKHLSEVKEKINDCQDMENFLDHCQLLLRTSFGFNFEDLYKLISYIARKRICFLSGGKNVQLMDGSALEESQAKSDLEVLKFVLCQLLVHDDVEKLTVFGSLNESMTTLLNEMLIFI